MISDLTNAEMLAEPTDRACAVCGVALMCERVEGFHTSIPDKRVYGFFGEIAEDERELIISSCEVKLVVVSKRRFVCRWDFDPDSIHTSALWY